MSVLHVLSRLQLHVADLITLAAHPNTQWNHARSVFTHRLVSGVALAGDTMVTSIVRALPRGNTAMKHRYKNFDRMLGEVDVVPIAAAQTELLGNRVGKDGGDWVIPVDLSDIHKPYAEAMGGLSEVRDGSTGEVCVNGFGLATACAIDLSAGRKAVPLPLNFEVYSTTTGDFVSQPHIWLEMLNTLCDVTPGGTFALDRECDNGRILHRILDRGRDFVARLQVGQNARNLRWFDAKVPGVRRVGTICDEAKVLGRIEATRVSHDGQRSPYVADVSVAEVRLPDRPERLWLCIYRCPAHEQPMALLTTHPVRTVEELGQTLARYFARWTVEELHRFAKQSFRLENVRTLTWHRTQNVVAAVWIVLGALALEGLLTGAEATLRVLEKASDRVEDPLTNGQFWGYALMDGIRLAVRRNPLLLRLCTWLWRVRPVLQMPLFGLRA